VRISVVPFPAGDEALPSFLARTAAAKLFSSSRVRPMANATRNPAPPNFCRRQAAQLRLAI
jgi:hypothetical protein